RAPGALPDGPGSGRGRFQSFVDADVPVLGQFDARFFEADPIGVRRAASSDENVCAFDGDRAIGAGKVEANPFAGTPFDALYAGREVHGDAFGLEDALDLGGDVGVFAAEQLRSGFDDGDVAAEAPESLPKFETNIAATDHEQVPGHVVNVE